MLAKRLEGGAQLARRECGSSRTNVEHLQHQCRCRPLHSPAQRLPWGLPLQLRQVLVALPTCRGKAPFESLLEMVPLSSPRKALLRPPATTSRRQRVSETLSCDDAARSEIHHMILCWSKYQ
jgi:hypothetical protein